MKISVITSRYAISGVPLAQKRFASALSKHGHNVEYIISHLYKVDRPEIDNVKVRVFDKVRAIQMLFPLIRYFKQFKPDVIFTAGDHINVIVTFAVIFSRIKTKISASSRVTPFDTYSNVPFSKRWILKQLARITMSKVDALTCVSEDMVHQYRQVFKNPPHVCVYNIVNDLPSQQKMLEPVDEDWFDNKSEPIIVAAGQLEPWKGFNDLILAMAELSKTRKAKLIIFGEGSMRPQLQAMINDLGLKTSVKLFGHVSNPLKYFRNADVFVLSSYVEGLPNVLVEAMMCGCTPVSTDCPTGPSEVLQEGKYGYLVPMRDPISMSKGIEQALDSPISKDLLREAVEPFSEELVIKRHFDILGIENFGKLVK